MNCRDQETCCRRRTEYRTDVAKRLPTITKNDSGADAGAFGRSTVTGIVSSAFTSTRSEYVMYPGALISTRWLPAGTISRTRGVCPSITASRKTVAPSGLEVMLIDPFPATTMVVGTVGGSRRGAGPPSAAVRAGIAGVVLGPSMFRDCRNVDLTAGLDIVMVYIPGGRSGRKPLLKYPVELTRDSAVLCMVPLASAMVNLDRKSVV